MVNPENVAEFDAVREILLDIARKPDNSRLSEQEETDLVEWAWRTVIAYCTFRMLLRGFLSVEMTDGEPRFWTTPLGHYYHDELKRGFGIVDE